MFKNFILSYTLKNYSLFCFLKVFTAKFIININIASPNIGYGNILMPPRYTMFSIITNINATIKYVIPILLLLGLSKKYIQNIKSKPTITNVAK